MKSRNYCLTLWVEHQPDGLWEWVLEAYVEASILRFAAYGEETCPTTGQKHLQTYVCFPAPVSFERARHLFPKSHVERMEGTLKDNEVYCSKESQLVKIGDEPVCQGRRTDLIRVRDMVNDGERPMKIARTSKDEKTVATVVRHFRFFQEQYSEVSWELRCEEGFKPPKVIIYTGVSGVSKTRRIWEEVGYKNAGTELFKVWDNTGEYYNGYHGQSIVLFEDVQKGQKLPKLSVFKELLDGYPVRVNIKFGEPVVFAPSVIYITSNHEWTTWYDYTPEDIVAIKRRITRLVKVYTQQEEDVIIDQDAKEEVHGDYVRSDHPPQDRRSAEEEVPMEEEVDQRD